MTLDHLKVEATRATLGAQVQAARGLLGWTRARLSSECGLSKRSLWNIEKGLTARPLAKTQIAICSTFEAAGIGFTINALPNLRARKVASSIAPAIKTKFAVGDDVHFHPIAGGLIAVRIIRSKGTNARKRRGEPLPHQAPNRAARADRYTERIEVLRLVEMAPKPKHDAPQRAKSRRAWTHG